jgi:hypothetical protein
MVCGPSTSPLSVWVIALHEGALASAIRHDAALRIGEVTLCRIVRPGLFWIAGLGLAARFLFARALLLFFAFALGLLFGCPLKRLLSLTDLLQPALTPLQLIGQFVAAPILAVLCILFGIGLFGGGHQGFDLLLDTRHGLVHALVAHRLVLASTPACIRLDLGAIDGHVSLSPLEFDLYRKRFKLRGKRRHQATVQKPRSRSLEEVPPIAHHYTPLHSLGSVL